MRPPIQVFALLLVVWTGCGKEHAVPTPTPSQLAGEQRYVYRFHIGRMSDPPPSVLHTTTLTEIARLQNAARVYNSRVSLENFRKGLSTDFLGQAEMFVVLDLGEEGFVMFSSSIPMQPEDRPSVERVVKAVDMMLWLTLRGLQGDSDTALLDKINKWESQSSCGSTHVKGVNSGHVTDEEENR